MVIILADCSTHTVQVITGDPPSSHSSNDLKGANVPSALNHGIEDAQAVAPSDTVASMLEEFVELHTARCAPTFLISFLEDRLGQILAKSDVLIRLVSSGEMPPNIDEMSKNGSHSHPSQQFSPMSSSVGSNNSTKGDDLLSIEQVSSVLDCHTSDLRLIVNVAAVYNPQVLSSVIS